MYATHVGMFLCVVGWMHTSVSEQRDASIQYEDHNPGIQLCGDFNISYNFLN